MNGGMNRIATSRHQCSGLRTTRRWPVIITLPFPSRTEMVGWGFALAAMNKSSNQPKDNATTTMDSTCKIRSLRTALSLADQRMLGHGYLLHLQIASLLVYQMTT